MRPTVKPGQQTLSAIITSKSRHNVVGPRQGGGEEIQPAWTSTPTPPNGEIGVSYNYNLAQHLNTTKGVVLSLQAGTLPAGLSLSGFAIVGVPTTAETQAGLVVRATNSVGFADSGAFALTIDASTQPALIPAARLDDPVVSSKGVLDTGTETVTSGGSGEYPITGTTFFVTPSMSLTDVNNLAAVPGDGVLFEAGGVWQASTAAQRLQPKSGVIYGRYGQGNNPTIQAVGSVNFGTFRALVDINGVNNVLFDSIDVRNLGDFNHFLLHVDNSTDCTISNLKAYNSDSGGVVASGGSGHLFSNIEITAVKGKPHESLTFSGASNCIAEHIWAHNNDHCGINTKDASTDIEVRYCLLDIANVDPLFYIERAARVHYHHNYIKNQYNSRDGKPLLSMGIENFGSLSTQYNRDITIENNVFYLANLYCISIWIKGDVTSTVTPKQQNIMFRKNTLVHGANVGVSWAHAIQADDTRADNEPSTMDPNDWQNLTIQDNIIWDVGTARSINIRQGALDPAFTIDWNCYETGAQVNPGAGPNAVFTSDVQFQDLANENYLLQPTSPAAGAASDGGNMGADLDVSQTGLK